MITSTPARALGAFVIASTTSLACAQDIPPLGEPQPNQPHERDPVNHEAQLKNPDGSWKYTNRLIDATSPYLLQHAHNPVDWYPWGEEAFDAARKSGKPILLSVGYSTCYWCHVMEREVFTDPEIAEAMNEAFVNIKLDREERPDLDQIYMLATQLMTGSGGWPNNVFLRHDLKPFFGGTYFGPETAVNPDGSIARPGFPLIIEGITSAWNDQRDVIDQTAQRLDEALQTYLRAETSEDSAQELTPARARELVDTALAAHAQFYDDQFGGFGIEPKFPNGYHYALLLDVAERSEGQSRTKTRDMALTTLRQIARAGIHDHVGGGFHRYATDQQWNIPHFEKMLYNQAQLGAAYATAFARTGDPVFEHAARRAFEFVERDMTSPDGAFYSAIDAETDAVEGASYVWTPERAAGVLDGADLALFNRLYTLTPIPEFPGHYHADGQVLHLRATHTELAAELQITTDELLEKIDPIMDALLSARSERKQPRLDDKIITAWNALMIDALARAGDILEDDDLIARAERAATFVHDNLRNPDGSLARIWRTGQAEGNAFLEDYALLAQAYRTLSRALGENQGGHWLARSLTLREEIEDRFADETDSAYFFAESSPNLIARSKSPADGAIPSGNSAMAHFLIDLADDERLDDDTRAQAQARAKRLLARYAPIMSDQPGAHMNLVYALERWAATSGPEHAPLDLDPRGGAPQPTDSAAHVDFTAKAPPTVTPGEPFDVTITLDIDEGWHVSANPPSLQFLIPTRVDVRPAEGEIEIIETTYPPGHESTLGGDSIRVYTAGDVIRVRCRVPEGAQVGEASARVLASFQACDDSTCLKPAQRAKTLRFVLVK